MNGKLTEQKWFIYALVPVVALLWGMSFLGTSITLGKLKVMEVLALRWTVAAVLFCILLAFRLIKVSYKNKDVKSVLLVGIIQPCIYSIFEILGIKYTTTSESAIFIATIPIMVLIIGAVFLHQKTSKGAVGAIIMAFAGVVVCTAFSPDFSLGSKSMGYVYLIGAVVSGGIFSHVSSRASREFDAIEITFTISMMGAIFFNLLNFAQGNGVNGYVMCFIDGGILAGILFLGIGCSCMSYLIYNFILAKLPATIGTNLVANSVTAVGVISGCIFAGDAFGWYTAIGVMLIIIGICAASAASE